MKGANLKNERGELVNDRMRPDTFADYVFRKSPMGKKRLHWPAKTGGPRFRTYIWYGGRSETGFLHKGREINEAISISKNNKTPGPNGVTSELI